jgi:UDP-GlcNAc:undecaprenyl-phosphate/decaprenyl-phosphate GlcNAc-1-phosphate transferase
MLFLSALVSGYLLVLALLPLVLRRLRQAGIVDHPNARSSHVRPTVRGAGVAFAPTTLLLLTGSWVITQDSTLLIAGGLSLALTALGFADDVRSQSPVLRLMVQFVCFLVACLLLGFSGLALASALVISVYYVNAFNFMDGINGLSIATSGVAAIYFGFLGVAHDESTLLIVSALLLSCSLGFSPWNLTSGRAFLGDAGSYFFGGVIAFGCLVIIGDLAYPLALPPLLLYLFDTGWTLLRRTIDRQPFGSAHRNHVYQRAAQSSGSHLRVTLTITGLGMVSIVSGILYSLDFIAASPFLITQALLGGIYLLGLNRIVSFGAGLGDDPRRERESWADS